MRCRASSLLSSAETRPIPYIYTPDEIARILDAAGNLRRQKPNPLRRQLYVMLFGLIAATGLRVSEALNLRLDDLLPDGVLHIRQTKFNKSRLVPLHPSVVEALERYLEYAPPVRRDGRSSVPIRGRQARCASTHGELYLPLHPATGRVSRQDRVTPSAHP